MWSHLKNKTIQQICANLNIWHSCWQCMCNGIKEGGQNKSLLLSFIVNVHSMQMSSSPRPVDLMEDQQLYNNIIIYFLYSIYKKFSMHFTYI